MRIAILGTGYMAAQHTRRLLKFSDDVEIVGVCGTSEDSARAFVARSGIPHAATFGDLERMLDTLSPDALYVCVPPDAAWQTIKGAERGIHLFLEKPIAYDAAGAEKIVEAVERAGVHSQVGYHMRFRSSVRRFKEAVASGEAGRPTLFEGRFWTHFSGPSWWANKSRSNGQIHEQVIHLYDLALHLFGPADFVMGQVDTLCHADRPAYSIEDTSVGIIRFQSGALATVTGSNCAVPGFFLGDFRVVCGRAMLNYQRPADRNAPDEAMLFLHDGIDAGEAGVRREEFTETGDPYLAQTERFLATLKGEAPPFATAREGYEGIRLVEAVVRSAGQSGATVSLR